MLTPRENKVKPDWPAPEHPGRPRGELNACILGACVYNRTIGCHVFVYCIHLVCKYL